jgi:hypothetical protein
MLVAVEVARLAVLVEVALVVILEQLLLEQPIQEVAVAVLEKITLALWAAMAVLVL